MGAAEPVGGDDGEDDDAAWLETLALQLDGQPAASSTFRRKRAVFKHALGYAVELVELAVNPGPSEVASSEAERGR